MPRRQKMEDNESDDECEESEHSLEDSHSEASDDDESATKRKHSNRATSKKRNAVKKPPATKKANNDLEDEELETFHPTSSEEGDEGSEGSDNIDKDDEDYQEEGSEDSLDYDDDEEYTFNTQKRRTSTRKKAATTKRKSSPKTPPSKDARKPPPEKAIKAPSRARAKRGHAQEESSSSSEEAESGESEEEAPTRVRGSRGKRQSLRHNRKSRASYKDVGSSGEDSSDGDSESSDPPQRRQSASKRRPSRASAAKATAKMAQLRYKQDREDSEDEEEKEEDSKPRARKKRRVDSEEEDFKIDENADDDEDAELDKDAKSSGEESFLKGVHSVPSDTQVGNADSSDFGEDEASDGGDDTGKATMQGGRNVSIGKTPASDDEHAEIEPTPTKARLSQEERTRTDNKHRKNAPPRIPCCPSEVDEITTDQLPPIHVCYLSPDGNSRQCFCLETLHKIATMSSHPQYRTNLSNERQLTFLQPPHFRSAMSDELLDQIASRFGRNALDLNGEFYQRKNRRARASAVGSDDDAEEEEYQVNFTRVHTDQGLFMSSWRDYQIRTMGSQDLYPCPLCYAVAHHRLASPPPESDEEKDIPLPEEFSFDPMAVLGSLDNDNFETAAGFCFTKIAKVKEHIRNEHSCNTVRIDNAVFFRYKVRTQDGLLQRFLAKNKTYGRNPKQGDMRRYWYEGNSESFIYLLYQMEQLRYEKAHDNHESGSESGINALAKCRSYFQSFRDNAMDLWERISSPFSAGKEDDMQDFLDDGEEVGEEAGIHHVFDREEAAAVQEEDEELARYYKEKAEEKNDDESRQYAEDQSENEDNYEPVEASESEEDEWVLGIRNKKRRGSTEKPARSKGRSGGRRLSSRKEGRKYAESSSDEELDANEPASTSKRAILEDSDSD